MQSLGSHKDIREVPSEIWCIRGIYQNQSFFSASSFSILSSSLSYMSGGPTKVHHIFKTARRRTKWTSGRRRSLPYSATASRRGSKKPSADNIVSDATRQVSTMASLDTISANTRISQTQKVPPRKSPMTPPSRYSPFLPARWASASTAATSVTATPGPYSADAVETVSKLYNGCTKLL